MVVGDQGRETGTERGERENKRGERRRSARRASGAGFKSARAGRELASG
jgi:hypothetical protein